MIFGLVDFNGHVGRRIDGFEGVHGGYEIGERSVEKRRLHQFCNEKEFFVGCKYLVLKERTEENNLQYEWN